MSEAPTAYRISTPNTDVKRGTITTPPPNPVSDPKKPALNDASQTSKENSRMFTRHFFSSGVKRSYTAGVAVLNQVKYKYLGS